MDHEARTRPHAAAHEASRRIAVRIRAACRGALAFDVVGPWIDGASGAATGIGARPRGAETGERLAAQTGLALPLRPVPREATGRAGGAGDGGEPGKASFPAPGRWHHADRAPSGGAVGQITDPTSGVRLTPPRPGQTLPTMKVLVVGSGGREHALCWKIAQSPLVDAVLAAPGNAGIASLATCHPVKAEDLDGQVALAKKEKVDLVVIGPEAPLCAGLVDRLEAAGIRAFGPSARAAEIEGSKAFARELCKRNRIPQPGFWVFDDQSKAMAFLDNRSDGPIVVKASGLAAGKGVVVAKNSAEARQAVRACADSSRFGSAGATLVLEEKLEGPEVSVMALTDGKTFLPFDPARDHKPVFDGDEGPNTGGMGAVSPAPGVRGRVLAQIESRVLLPAIHGLKREDRPFRGFLYAGLMLTAAGPHVLEFNARLGDPETQPLLMRLESDLVPYLIHATEGRLDELEGPVWDKRTAVCVMACSRGYPGDYPKSLPIVGLDRVETGPDLQVFHSGTARRGSGDVVTAGGRVLAVCALGDDVEAARERAYEALGRIDFQGMHYRRDIGLSKSQARRSLDGGSDSRRDAGA
jgi:phosphoribosylamine--glycine ligase